MTKNIHHSIDGAYQYNAYHKGICFQKSWHQLKFHFAEKLINPKTNDNILDAACGSGVLTGLLSKENCAFITGIDFNEESIQFCNQQYKRENTNYILQNLNDMNFDDKTFNKISFLEILEHLQREAAEKLLINFGKILKPDGYLVLSTPNRNSLWPFIEYILDFFKLTPAMKGEQHVKLYNQKDLTELLKQVGFKKITIYKTHFVAPWLSFLGLKFAQRIFNLERKIGWLPGSLLFAVAEK